MHPGTWHRLGPLQHQQDYYRLSPVPPAAVQSLFGVPVLTRSQISTAETTGSKMDCFQIVACLRTSSIACSL
jgi:hypothetical protein